MEGTNFTAVSSELQPHPGNYSRAEQADLLFQFDVLRRDFSQRAASEILRVPRSNLAYWSGRRDSHNVPAEVANFFESPCGLQFLRRFMCALHLVFHQTGSSGIRPLCEFLRLIKLDSFVAASYGTNQQFSHELQRTLVEIGEEEKLRLGSTMERRQITVAKDETFHPAVCLVAMEPCSGFILLETYAQNRDAATWTQAFTTALVGLNVDVIQVTSDESRTLIKHIRDGLNAQHSTDLFHIQQDLHRGFAYKLSSGITQAEAKVTAAQEKIDGIEKKRDEYLALPDTGLSKESFNEELRIAQLHKKTEEIQAQEAVRQRDEVLMDLRKISDDYHPFRLDDGTPQNEKVLEEKLNDSFARIEEWAVKLQLTKWARKKIAKAKKSIPLMVAVMAFFWKVTKERIQQLDMTDAEERHFIHVVGALYLQLAARKSRPAAERKRILALSDQVMHEWKDPLARLPPDHRTKVLKMAQSCAELFQRSSSCVEGRNGQLALKHHALHKLSDLKLAALTVVHNYYVRRSDGTTAAERFFGNNQRDIFEMLVQRMPLPSRPKRRPK